jgi:hypothetical protein
MQKHPGRGPLPGAGCASALCLCSSLLACGPGSPADPDSQGFLTVDSNLVIDGLPFSSARCDEVAPAGSPNSDTLFPGDSLRVRVTSTACYAVRIAILDSAGREVRGLDRRFRIHGRRDGEKDRGAVGYLGWDGRDERALPLPRGRYLWRLEFDFGGGRRQRFRADMGL